MQDVKQDSVLSVVVPCYNESQSIDATVASLDTMLRRHFGQTPYEIILIDDGSTDDTGHRIEALARSEGNVRALRHSRNQGYGAALKTGIANAHSDRIAIIDADGTYPIDQLPDLLKQGDVTMVVGSRTGNNVTYSRLRRIPKIFLRAYAQWVTRETIPDINSGMRVFDRALAEAHYHILPDGFSFTTTITIAALMDRKQVIFHPIDYAKREGQSKIAPIRDTLRFALLILRTGMYFAPLRMLAPFIWIAWLISVGSLIYDVFVLDDLRETSLLAVTVAINLSILALVSDMLHRRTAV